MKLVILDLDKTLVDFIAIHDETALELFRHFFGVDAKFTDVDYVGRSFADNFAEMARRRGVLEDEFKKKLPRLLADYDRVFAGKMPPDAPKYVLPGAKEILEGLSLTDNLVVLYTGDPRGIVDTVFRATGLGKYFKYCQYGSEVKTRADMVRRALAKAEELTGKQFQGKDIVIIGDSIRDIEVGKEFGALTIAVATGFHTAGELAARQPDYLFKSLRDYRKVIKAIGGNGNK